MSSCPYSMVFDQTALERKPSLSNKASPVITHINRITDKIIIGLSTKPRYLLRIGVSGVYTHSEFCNTWADSETQVSDCGDI